MSTVPSYFKDFLSNIRLSDNQVSDLKTGHTTLRKRGRRDAIENYCQHLFAGELPPLHSCKA